MKGLVLMTPFYLHPDKNNPMRALMDNFGNVIATLAEKHQAVLVDTQKAFDAVMEWNNPLQLAQDRIHVNTPGHMVLARAFLQAVGYSW
jgi:lysophospholipase L1-like esterase